jgi:hypothetical protein
MCAGGDDGIVQESLFLQRTQSVPQYPLCECSSSTTTKKLYELNSREKGK